MIRKLLLALAVANVGLAAAAQAQDKSNWEGLKTPINLFVANDLGRNGYYEQRPIASLMGEMAEVIGPDAVLALGDIHHFEGVQSVNDPLWMTNYETIYSHPELMIDWLPVCGNHEYRGNTQAVVDYSKISRRWDMQAKYYSRTFSDKGTSVKVIFLDTTPIIEKYRNDTIGYPDAVRQDVGAQLAWLDKELAEASEAWIVVAGHHPIYADTSKDESERSDMQRKVDSILRRHKVDMYICGHIHNFQHIRYNGIDYVVNSAGSLSRKKVKPIDGTVFTSGEAGFSILGVSESRLTLSMVDSKGTVIHQIVRTK